VKKLFTQEEEDIPDYLLSDVAACDLSTIACLWDGEDRNEDEL
jgi:hypothetical protein